MEKRIHFISKDITEGGNKTPIKGVRELKEHGINDIPQARLPWFQDFFKYVVDSSPFEGNKLVAQKTASLENFGGDRTKTELLWGMPIPDQFQKREEFGFVKQYFNYEHRGLADSCFCEAEGKLFFQFVVFFWFLDLFPDADFSKKYIKKLASFLKLIYVKKDVRYFDKTPARQIQILSGHIDAFLEGSSYREKMAFVWYLYYMECFTETSIAFDWNRMDGIASTWGTKKRRYVGVMSDRSEFLLEQLSKKGEKVKIFISHIENEKKAAIWIKETYAQLFGTSVKVFCASDRKSIPTGEEWYRWIVENILNASIVVILISPWSQNRPWVNFEAGIAKGASKKVIPVAYLGVETKGISFPLAGLQAIMLRETIDLKQVFDDCSSILHRQCNDLDWEKHFQEFQHIQQEILEKKSQEPEENNREMQTFSSLSNEFEKILQNIGNESGISIMTEIQVVVGKMLAIVPSIPRRDKSRIDKILSSFRLNPNMLEFIPHSTVQLAKILTIIGPYVDR